MTLKERIDAGFTVVFSNEDNCEDVRAAECFKMNAPGGCKYVIEFNGKFIGTWKNWRNCKYRLDKLIRQWSLDEKEDIRT